MTNSFTESRVLETAEETACTAPRMPEKTDNPVSLMFTKLFVENSNREKEAITSIAKT
jgi:hypothetical protein